jgi:hypothetical protein
MIFNSSKNKKEPSNLCEFWSEEVHNKKRPFKNKTMMSECHNLMNSMELEAITF